MSVEVKRSICSWTTLDDPFSLYPGTTEQCSHCSPCSTIFKKWTVRTDLVHTIWTVRTVRCSHCSPFALFAQYDTFIRSSVVPDCIRFLEIFSIQNLVKLFLMFYDILEYVKLENIKVAKLRLIFDFYIFWFWMIDSILLWSEFRNVTMTK